MVISSRTPEGWPNHVVYFDSAALGKLINLKKQLGGAGRRLTLRHVHPDLVELFRITRLDRVFDLES
jgi:anti-sigma B factor antagonist